jgi:hypothetical protein
MGSKSDKQYIDEKGDLSDKVRYQQQSHQQSSERIELDIQKLLQRTNGKLFNVLRNQQHTHPSHPLYKAN